MFKQISLVLFLSSYAMSSHGESQGLEIKFSLSGGSFTPLQSKPSKSSSLGIGELGFAYTFYSGIHLGASFQSLAFSQIDSEQNSSEWDGDGLSLYLGHKWSRLKLMGGLLSSSIVRRAPFTRAEYNNKIERGSVHGSFLYLGYTLFKERSFDIDLYAKSLHLSLSRYGQREDSQAWASQQIGLAIQMYPQNWNFSRYNHGHSYYHHHRYHYFHGSGDLLFGLIRALAYSGKHLARLVIR